MQCHFVAKGDYAYVSINNKNPGGRTIVLYLDCLYDWFAKCINLKQ